MMRRQEVELSVELFPANFYKTTRCHLGITCREMTECELHAASPAHTTRGYLMFSRMAFLIPSTFISSPAMSSCPSTALISLTISGSRTGMRNFFNPETYVHRLSDMQQGTEFYFRNSNGCSASQISINLWNPPLTPILSQINPVYTLPSSVRKITFTVILKFFICVFIVASFVQVLVLKICSRACALCDPHNI
jgi:hypothetical protein